MQQQPHEHTRYSSNISTAASYRGTPSILKLSPKALSRRYTKLICLLHMSFHTIADPGGARGLCLPPGPVKISHKKDCCQRRPHRFHVSWPPLPDRWILCCHMLFYNSTWTTFVSIFIPGYFVRWTNTLKPNWHSTGMVLFFLVCGENWACAILIESQESEHTNIIW